MPTKLANGWTAAGSQYDSAVKGAVSAINQEYPDANVIGTAYNNPLKNTEILLILQSEEQIETYAALYVFSTEQNKSQPGTYTYCGESEDADRFGCATTTDPSVMGLYFGSSAFDQDSLGKLIAEYQADL